MGAPLSGYYQFPVLNIKMPGHDHSLRKLYTIEGLSNPSMVYNWICPILLKEDCPMRLWHVSSACISKTLVGSTPVKTILILGGPPHSSPSQTGPP